MVVVMDQNSEIPPRLSHILVMAVPNMTSSWQPHAEWVSPILIVTVTRRWVFSDIVGEVRTDSTVDTGGFAMNRSASRL